MKMMQNKVIGVISQLPVNRATGDIRMVLPWLRKKSDLLSGCKDEVLHDVIKNCDYCRAYRDEVIVTQGETGDCFYIMLSGKTSVYIDTSISDEDVEPDFSIPGSLGTGKMARSVDVDDGSVNEDGGDLSDTEKHSVKKKKPLDRSQYGKFIRHFEAGKSFGEIALISEDSVRNATVIADEQTDMLLVHRDLFNRSVKAEQEKEYAERKDFIDSCRLFSDWSPKFKHLLMMSIRKEVYHYGTKIMKQGDPVEGLFFIVSGQAKLTTEPTKHHQQFPVLTTQVSLMEQEFGRHNKDNLVRKSQNGLTQHHIRVRRKEGYAAAERRFMTKSLDLCCVEGQEIQGDMEVVMEMNTCACTVTCTANTTVFILDNKTFDRLVLKKNMHTVNRLKQGVLKKLQSRIATTNGGNVPLLKMIHDKLLEELKPKVTAVPKTQTTAGSDKQTVLQQMIKLYLKDKAPLIDPLLPDSFYNRIMAEKRNKVIAKSEKKKEDQATYMRLKRRRMPRSLKQLQTNAAETELMHPNRSWLEQTKPSKDSYIRPKTALGIEATHFGGESVVLNNRPETAAARTSGIFHLTECENTEEMGNKVAKEKAVLVTEDYNHVFQQIDSIQRGKAEARSKVICSAAAKSEIRNETERAHLGFAADDIYDMHDDDYFDYETSATNLKHLEERIKLFCREVSQRRNSDPLRFNEMKTFEVKNSDSVPMSGGTVFVNRKPCSYPRNARLTADVHQHVRRFMITRDLNRYTSSSASINGRSKSTPFAGIAKRPKSAW